MICRGQKKNAHGKMPLCRVQKKALGKDAFCRVPKMALGKIHLCRVPKKNTRQSHLCRAPKKTLGKAVFAECSIKYTRQSFRQLSVYDWSYRELWSSSSYPLRACKFASPSLPREFDHWDAKWAGRKLAGRVYLPRPWMRDWTVMQTAAAWETRLPRWWHI